MTFNTLEHTMKIQTAVSAAVLLAASSFTFAQAPAGNDATATPRIDRREARQEQRIANGVASGELTGKEAARLERREGKIRSDEAAAKADGVVTPAERKHLRREENGASHAIHRQKHDGQKAAKAP
jgi:hypothetical protein